MKKFIALALLLSPFTSFARTVTVQWDASTSTDVTSYQLFTTTTPGQYAASPAATVNGSTLSFQFTTLPNTGVVYGIVKAVNSSGLVSPASNEVVLATAPAAPSNLRVTGL